MKTILIIGIGAGDPDYVTMQAVKALNRVDVFFILDKGAEKTELIELRREICRRYITGDKHRFVEAESPAWDRNTPDYLHTVDALNQRKQAVFTRLIRDEMADGECGAFLVWGDPALYDSTIRIVDKVRAEGLVFDHEVIAGITSVQALAARHRIPFTGIGETLAVTTGRKLRDDGFPDAADSVAVMLDGGGAYERLIDQDIDIFWGAYLGLPDEILISGKLKDVAAQIAATRAQARAEKGWIMDTYLLRKSPRDG